MPRQGRETSAESKRSGWQSVGVSAEETPGEATGLVQPIAQPASGAAAPGPMRRSSGLLEEVGTRLWRLSGDLRDEVARNREPKTQIGNRQAGDEPGAGTKEPDSPGARANGSQGSAQNTPDHSPDDESADRGAQEEESPGFEVIDFFEL